jgi:ribosomal-protein-alanine N-acetyltransferase
MLWARRKSPLNSPDEGILVGRDVILRPAIEGDRHEWLLLRAKNKDYLQPYEPAWPHDALTPEFYERRLARTIRDWQEDRSYSFLIFHKDTGDMIGGININNVIRGAAQFASIGYWIDEEMQGHGYMFQAAKEVVSFCFDTISLSRINAACMPHNIKSKNLLLKLGFTEEGFANNYLQINGKREDHILFGYDAESYLRRSV